MYLSRGRSPYTFEFDDDGDLVTWFSRHSAPFGASGKTQYAYDAQTGLLAQVTDPAGNQ